METDTTSSNETANDSRGAPIKVVKVTDNQKFELDVQALSSILMPIRDTPVMVISVAGDSQIGNSILLNFLLRYLQSDCGAVDWFGDHNKLLKGFACKGGLERETTGFVVWSQPFLVTQEDGKQVAIILMDTQESFDNENTEFALSAMISSVQLFSLVYELLLDGLEALDSFIKHRKFEIEETNEKPIQKLLVLVHNWSYPYEYPYGMEGGQKLLEKKLAIKHSQSNHHKLKLKRVNRNIRLCCKQINCLLLPRPGSKVSTNPEDFDGRLADIDPEFTEQLQLLVPLMLEPKNLVVKEICGRQVTGRELLEYFKVCTNIFAGETMPLPKSMLEATAEANNLTAVSASRDGYITDMEDSIGGDRQFMNTKSQDSYHYKCDETFDLSDKNTKVCSKEYILRRRIKNLVPNENNRYSTVTCSLLSTHSLSKTHFGSNIGKVLAANKKSQ